MTLVYCLGLTCIYEGWQYHNLVDVQLCAKPDPIPLSDILAKSAKCYTRFRSSGSNLIINVRTGQSACQIGEFSNSDGRFGVRLFRCWLVYYLNLFVPIVRSNLSHACNMRSTDPCIFVSVLAFSVRSSA